MTTKLDLTTDQARALESYLSHVSNFHKTRSYIDYQPFYTNEGRIDLSEKEHSKLLEILESLRAGTRQAEVIVARRLQALNHHRRS